MTESDQYQPKIEGVDVRKFLKTATPISLKQWLETLPQSNPSALGNYLVQILKAIDDIDVLPMTRFSLTDTVRPYAYGVVSALTQGFMGSQKGFSKQFQSIINQAMVLQGQLVASYSTQGNKARLMGDQQAFIMGSAMHRALADQYSMLSFYLKLSLPVPQQLWRQVNRVYKMVEDAKLQAHIMGDNVRLTEQMLTIKQMYTALLMLGSARTNMLSPDDVSITAQGVKRWVLHADLTDKPPAGLEHALAVDLDSPDGAVFEEVTVVKPGLKKRYLITPKLLAQMEKLRGQKLKVDDREVEIHDELVTHLVQSWGEFIERDNVRTERHDSVTTALGLATVHFYLSGGLSPLELIGGAAPAPSAAAPQGKLVLGDIPEEFSFHTYLPADITTVDQSRFPSSDVRVIDESSGGYCLEWPEEFAPKLHTGEIVGIKEVYAPYWKIGEIVWQKKMEESVIKTGIRLLSTEALPLVARIPQNMGDRGDNHPCFLLPKDVGLGLKQPTFLAPNVRLQMGEKIRIAQEKNEQSIQLMAPVKQTAHYSQFECAYIVLTQPAA